MRFHAEHGLFFDRRPTRLRVVVASSLTICVLVANVAASNTMVSLVGVALGTALLLIARTHGHRRITPAATWILVLLTIAILGRAAVGQSIEGMLEVGARVACGMVWTLWLGTQVDWTSLRGILERLRVPEGVTTSLDQALTHGVLTKREWTRRRDAARLRGGSSRLPMATWASVLSEGALRAFFRLERVEEASSLRRCTATTSDEDAGVRLESVDVKRGEHLVLERLDLALNPGEWLVVCGPSGTGKSSLLRLLAGLDAPARGTVSRLGAMVTPDTPLRARLDRRVALLGQSPEDHFLASTVAEDIAWGLLHRDVESEEAQRRALEIATDLSIAHLLQRPCHELSFGEQRRVALAGLLVLEPKLLLLDEPTAGLDPVAAHQLRTLVEDWTHRTGAACIWATHELHLLPASAERILLIRDHRVFFDGPTAEGLSRDSLVRAGLAVPNSASSSPRIADSPQEK